MSDTPRGPGWWLASDGRYYPPESDIAPAPPQAVPPGYQSYYGQPKAPAPGSATGALVSSILAWVVCPIIPAIVALVLASRASAEIRDTPGGRDGETMVTAARVISIAHLVLWPVIALILIAIAVPTFFGARDRAYDRAAQADLRNAFVAAKVSYTDTGQWPNAFVLAQIDPDTQFQDSDGIVTEGVVDVVTSGDAISMGIRSEGGTCFYIAAAGSSPAVGYAESDECGEPAGQRYGSEWTTDVT